MHRSKLEMLTRLGFAARGIMYVLIGFLALEAGRTEDGAGALEVLNGGLGKPVLALMAAGFAAYALWRLIDALFDSEGHGTDKKGLAKRLGGAASGIIHLGLAYLAFTLALGARDQGGGNSTREGAQTALSLPGGWVLLLIAALGLLAVGLYQLINAARGQFLTRLDAQAARMTWVRLAGRIGYAARGIVFLLIAWFFWRAGMKGRAGEAGGMAEALDSLPQSVQLVTAFGLLLFGLFSFVEARFRKLRDPADVVASHKPRF